MLKRRDVLAGLAGAGLFPLAASAATPDELWSLLRAGSSAALVRHANAPGGGDPTGYRLDDWSTQRNLDEKGRTQARSMGEAFRRRGIVPSAILTSQWRRCSETAELMDLGPVVPAPQALNSFFARRDLEPEFSREIGKLLADTPRGVGPLICVTHQVNVTAIARFVPNVGEAAVFVLEPASRFRFAGRLQLA
ncbi:MAG: histidine phosphatase family protein [Bosea sp. (in: a-proteobacteria)]